MQISYEGKTLILCLKLLLYRKKVMRFTNKKPMNSPLFRKTNILKSEDKVMTI